MVLADTGTRRPSAPSRASVLVAQLGGVAVFGGALLGMSVDLVGVAGTALLLVLVVLLGAAAAGWAALPQDSRLRRWTALVVLALAAGAAGVGLAVVGSFLGPLAMVVLPLALVASLTVLVRPVVAVVLVLLVIPVGLRELPEVPLGLQVIQVTALLAVAAAVLGRAVQGRAPVEVPAPLVWLVLLVPWGVVATLSAVSLDVAVRQVVALGVNVVLALVAVTAITEVAVLRRVLLLLVVVGAAASAPALLSGADLRSSYGGGVVSGRLQGTFTQPNQFGSFTMVVALVGAGVVLAARSTRQRALVLLALVPVVLGLLLSLSRSSWVGLVGGGLVLLVLLPSARRTLLAVAVPLVLAGLALGAFAPENPQVQVVGARVATLSEGAAANPYDSRPRIWAEGRREVLLSPVTGHGPGSFPEVSSRTASESSTVGAEHAHDVLLTVAAEYGLIGAALLVAMTGHVARVVLLALRRSRPQDRPLLAGLASACCAVAVQGLFDYTVRNAVLATFFLLLVGLTVAAARALPAAHDRGARAG